MIQHIKEQYKFSFDLVKYYSGPKEDLEREIMYQMTRKIVERLLTSEISQFETTTEEHHNVVTAHLVVVPSDEFGDLRNVLEYVLRKADHGTDAYKSAKKLIGDKENFQL